MEKIFVLYIGVVHVREIDIEEYVEKVAKAVIPDNIDGSVIVLPTNNDENRFVCINPEYITNDDLIKENSMLLFELNYELKKQLNIIKK